MPALDGNPSDTKVEKVPVEFGEAQGLLHANHAIYAITNSDKYPRGLWRITDTNGDDQFDKVEQLRAFENKGGEHGPHAVVLAPDGNSLYISVLGDVRKRSRDLQHEQVPDYGAVKYAGHEAGEFFFLPI